MDAFVLVIQLMRDGPAEKVMVHDCNEGVAWIHEAWRWAERSGLDEMQPMYVCYPANSPVLVRVVR